MNTYIVGGHQPTWILYINPAKTTYNGHYINLYQNRYQISHIQINMKKFYLFDNLKIKTPF